LFNGIKVLLLHPQQRGRSLKDWQEKGLKSNESLRKKFQKSLREINLRFTFAPRKSDKLFEILTREIKIYSLRKE
jgi:hypothetical protein